MKRPNNHKAFLETLAMDAPSALWTEALQAIWWDAKGNWTASHTIAQDIPSSLGYWIHGYLHRKEGDEWNAGYWYKRANRSFPDKSLDEELFELVTYILKFE